MKKRIIIAAGVTSLLFSSATGASIPSVNGLNLGDNLNKGTNFTQSQEEKAFEQNPENSVSNSENNDFLDKNFYTNQANYDRQILVEQGFNSSQIKKIMK